ncbi:MAG TPA: MFS transporter [Jatrophihabitans sp.]|nr:MFS transporter [Jatrophihabitans sp.]
MTSIAAEPVHRPVRQVVLQAPRPVKILILGVFVTRMGSFFATFATLFLTQRGFASHTLPAVLVAIGLAGMLGSLGGGWLADRIGSRASLVGSMIASSAAVAMLVVAPNHPTVVVAVCLVALCSQSYQPAASALLILNSAPADRVPTFAFFRLAMNVGAAIGAVIAGFVASRSYSALFSIEAIAYAACGMVVFLGLRHAQVTPTGARPDGPDTVAEPNEPALTSAPGRVDLADTAPHPQRNLPVWLLCALLFGVATVYAQYQSTLPLQVVRHGYTTAFYGALLAVNGVVVIAGELPISSVTRRLPWVVPLIGGVLVMTIGLAGAAMISLAAVIVVAFIAFTVGEMIFAPVTNAAVAAISPAGTEARYQGLLATAQSLGFSLGPAIGTTVFALSHHGLWIGTLLVAVALSTGIYGVWRISQ